MLEHKETRPLGYWIPFVSHPKCFFGWSWQVQVGIFKVVNFCLALHPSDSFSSHLDHWRNHFQLSAVYQHLKDEEHSTSKYWIGHTASFNVLYFPVYNRWLISFLSNSFSTLPRKWTPLYSKMDVNAVLDLIASWLMWSKQLTCWLNKNVL